MDEEAEEGNEDGDGETDPEIAKGKIYFCYIFCLVNVNNLVFCSGGSILLQPCTR